jgi:16S rRNA (guanine527-N7)-methyltransferase
MRRVRGLAMTPIDFWTTCSANGVVLDKAQVDALERYHNELKYWNQRVNMISRKDEDNIWDHHILHSLMLLKYVKIQQKARVLDVGTGGGLPGIPVKIARPDIKLLMVDSIKKKVSMTSMFAQHTDLKDVSAICARVEELVNDPHYRSGFDVVISRAVAKTDLLITWVRPLMKPTTVCAFLKGGDLSEEIAEAKAHHPGLIVEMHDLDVFGVSWFREDQKKVVVCRFAS